jgi:hypothetical protein
METGVKAFKAGDYKGAIKAFDEVKQLTDRANSDKALQTSPKNLTILDCKAAALDRAGSSQRALDVAKVMIDSDGSSPKVRSLI